MFDLPLSPEEFAQFRYEAAHRELANTFDRMLSVILVAEWLAMVAMALVISPHTWLGTSAQVHLHVWAAVGLGGLVCLPAAFLGRWRPGEKYTRYIIAAAQGMVTALVIHLGGGRIEWHFSVFASLAVLAAYRDVKVLLIGTAVVAVDHCVRGIFWPQSVYGVLDASRWRWMEHAAWVLAEDAFLIFNIQNSLKEMRRITKREVELETIGEAAIAKAVDRMIKDVRKIESTGDLTRSIDGSQHDATDRLAKVVNGFINTLRQIIDEVRQAAAVAASASEQMVGSLGAIQSTTQDLGTKAETAQGLAKESTDSANEGGQVIGETLASLGDISRTVDAGGKRVATLSDNADRIMKLTTVIQDIADQTNLLALNAAIESARAGEHGRGFAVVADEVRKLADRTAKTTQEIAVAITQMKADTDEAVGQMEESCQRVDASATQGGQARETLTHIIDNAQKVTHHITEMGQQFSTFGARADEMGLAVNDLSQRVDTLNGLVSRFKT